MLRRYGRRRAVLWSTRISIGVNIVRGAQVGGEYVGGRVGGGKVVKTTPYRPVLNDDTTQTAIDAYNLCEAIGVPVQIWWGGNYYATALPDSSCWLVWDKENTGNFLEPLARLDQPMSTMRADLQAHVERDAALASRTRHGVRDPPNCGPSAWRSGSDSTVKRSDVVMDLFSRLRVDLIACDKSASVCRWRATPPMSM